MTNRKKPFAKVNGLTLSRAEFDRSQRRFEIGNLDKATKCQLIRLLCDFPQLMDYWRFTNRAIWVNLEAPGATEEMKTGLQGLLDTLETELKKLAN